VSGLPDSVRFSPLPYSGQVDAEDRSRHRSRTLLIPDGDLPQDTCLFMTGVDKCNPAWDISFEGAFIINQIG